MFSNIAWATRGGLILGLAICLTGSRVCAQNANPATSPLPNYGQNYDVLKSLEDQQHPADSSSTFSTAVKQPTDPFSVISTGSLWQEKYGSVYTHRVNDALLLSCESSTVTLNDGLNSFQPLSDGTNDLSRGQKAGLQFHPIEALTLSGNIHNSVNDSLLSADSNVTGGTGFSAESRLPFKSVLTFGVNSDRTGADFVSGHAFQSTAYDAQLQQPLGPMPLTAVLKSHYDETTYAGSSVTRNPSLEQSLVWKPAQDTTVKMGLRQQHYQDFPGIANEFNQALFADWSQKIISDITWHSYAEMLNSRGIQDVAPAVPLASGANGTPQASTPGPTLSSALPLTLDDKTLTFSTGPSFLLQEDVSASIEYSNRWDQNPLPGSVGPEQRLSISLKGMF